MRNIQAIWIESKTIIDEVSVPAANAFVVDKMLCFIDASIIIFYFDLLFLFVLITLRLLSTRSLQILLHNIKYIDMKNTSLRIFVVLKLKTFIL